MAKQQVSDVQQLNEEFTRIFDAYRAKIDEITRRNKRNPIPGSAETATEPEPPPARQEVESIISRVSPKPVKNLVNTPPAPPHIKTVEITTHDAPPEAKPEKAPVSSVEKKLESLLVTSPVRSPNAPPLPVRPGVQVVTESESIIKEARRKAQRIIEEAEDTVKKEAKKKTQAQVAKMLAEAQQEAESIINKATVSVEKERAEAVAQLKEESERAVKALTEKCTQANREQAEQIIAEAREKAAKLLNDIIKHSQEIGKQLDEIINRAKTRVGDFETTLQAENSELSKIVTETQNKVRELTMVPKQEPPKPEVPAPAPNTPPEIKNKEPHNSPAMSVHLHSDNPAETAAGLFSGQVQMKSATAAFDYQYLKNLKKYLGHIPSIKYIQESASEREVSVMFDVKEPLPLVDILNKIPIIDEVIMETGDDICLIFKNNE
ncbi:MAG: hypothetical protein ABR886_05730 [Dehalococcoidales bacterium]|jgi:vacuolar-type H+-ATPase subunit H